MALLSSSRTLAVLLSACAACAPKPLRFEDAATDRADASATSVDGSDADGAFDASADGAGDAAVAEASVGDAGGGSDVVVLRDGGEARPSCASDPTREDCRVVEVVPQRSFCVGTTADALNATWNASPPICGLSLSPFAVDAYEVSVARFRVFNERWLARTLPAYMEASFANGVSLRVPLPPRTYAPEWNPSFVNCTWTDTAMGDRERHPINCVGWVLAMYFCAWEGGHLVTSTQFEYLARWHDSMSADGRTYAWGDSAPDCARTHYGRCTGDDGLGTRRVGSLAAGAVATVFDLSGNVADWVADDFATYATLVSNACWTRSSLDPMCAPTITGEHYARGSNYSNPTDSILRAVFRPGMSSSDAIPGRGFRCAYRR